MWWRRKPVFVEWDLVGDAAGGFGAVVYLSAAPMVIVHEVDATLPTAEAVAGVVEQWIALAPDRYRLNEDFEAFKAVVRDMDLDDS